MTSNNSKSTTPTTLLDLAEKKIIANTHFYYYDDIDDLILVARVYTDKIKMSHPDFGEKVFYYDQYNNENVIPVLHICKKPFYSVTLRDKYGDEWMLTSEPVVFD